MKRNHKYQLLTLLIFQICLISGQAQTDTSVLFKHLPAVWYIQNSYPSTQDSLVFSKISRALHNWGDRIEIYSNGDFVDAYSAPCGNDNRIHYTKGTWTLDTLTMILSTSVPIYLQDKTYKVSKVTADILILKRL